MLRPFLLTRASIGLAATAVEQTLGLPGRALEAVGALPGVPVRLAGGLVQTYLHAGQTLTGLAVKGDRVLAAVFPSRSDRPDWVTFDEDLPEARGGYGTAAGPRPNGGGAADHGGDTADDDDPAVPTGRVTPRRT